MFVNNFLAPMQVQLSPNLVSHTLGTGDEVIKFWKIKVKRHGRWGGEVRALLSPFSYAMCLKASYIFGLLHSL